MRSERSLREGRWLVARGEGSWGNVWEGLGGERLSRSSVYLEGIFIFSNIRKI